MEMLKFRYILCIHIYVCYVHLTIHFFVLINYNCINKLIIDNLNCWKLINFELERRLSVNSQSFIVSIKKFEKINASRNQFFDCIRDFELCVQRCTQPEFWWIKTFSHCFVHYFIFILIIAINCYIVEICRYVLLHLQSSSGPPLQFSSLELSYNYNLTTCYRASTVFIFIHILHNYTSIFLLPKWYANL